MTAPIIDYRASNQAHQDLLLKHRKWLADHGFDPVHKWISIVIAKQLETLAETFDDPEEAYQWYFLQFTLIHPDRYKAMRSCGVRLTRDYDKVIGGGNYER